MTGMQKSIDKTSMALPESQFVVERHCLRTRGHRHQSHGVAAPQRREELLNQRRRDSLAPAQCIGGSILTRWVT